MMKQAVKTFSRFTDFDIALFKSGKHYKLYEKFGAHPMKVEGEEGVYFAVWAPAAKAVSVVGDFNYWIEGEHPLQVRWDESGIWEGFIPKVKSGTKYKYSIQSNIDDRRIEKADPFAMYCENPPNTASIVHQPNYRWKDQKWLKKRAKVNRLDQPNSVYEVHLSSWKRNVEENRFLSYEELADQLVRYVAEMGFTHVELMPIMEFPYDPSWGYQITGYFAPSSRFGNPEAFAALVDAFHQADIAVILDWVPSHFPADAHGLGNFDGSCVYEHPDIKKGYHPDWKSLIFNYERAEVRSFLISNAAFWCDQYHIDGLRVDAVASILYLDYSREDGEWEPNEFGGRENLAAISFLKELNYYLYSTFDGIQTIAEESTSFPMVSKPTDIGGLGFGMKWMMGWMHDTLEYFKKDPIYRSYHQNDITFSMTYAFSENFMLPLSHDEVVYGKQSLLGRMPGDEWQRFANLRLMYAYMFTHPGTKLLFMGGEFGQSEEWNFQSSLNWHLLQYDYHKGIQKLIQDLNQLYKSEKALYELQFTAAGFEWIDFQDHQNAVLSYIRKGKNKKEQLIVVMNGTPRYMEDYTLGVPKGKQLQLIFNSDAEKYGGSKINYAEIIEIQNSPAHNQKASVSLEIPPLGIHVYKLIF